MAQEDYKLGEPAGAAPTDAATQLKKRARRRLIGAVALALLAAIVLPMVMDHQPAPPLKDIQVRIPSPDEGVSQRVASQPPVAALARGDKAEKFVPPPSEPVSPAKEPATGAKPAEPGEIKPIAKPEAKPEPKTESKPEAKAEPKPEPKPAVDEAARAQNALAGKVSAGEAWEVQLGAYQEPGRVKLLVGKLKELGIPTYTEKVDTPNGPRTRVRAGPFPTQDAAEKARARVKIVGVDGPVAKKP